MYPSWQTLKEKPGKILAKFAQDFRIKDLIVGADVVKKTNYAGFIDNHGYELCKHYLNQTGFSRNLLSIPGIGVVTAARFLGEVGDISKFDSPEQIIKLAGLNLKTNSSGQRKGKTTITKRCRSELRSLLYQSELIIVCKNEQMIKCYQRYRSRSVNPLKSK